MDRHLADYAPAMLSTPPATACGDASAITTGFALVTAAVGWILITVWDDIRALVGKPRP